MALAILQGVVEPALQGASVKMMGCALLQVHIDQQDVAVAGFGEAGGEPGSGGGDASAFATTCHGDELGLVSKVFELEKADQPIAQGFVKRPQRRRGGMRDDG